MKLSLRYINCNHLTKLILVLWLILPVSASAKQWHVQPNGEPLDLVVKKAAAGDEIILAAGHYFAQLYIDKPLTLRGLKGAIIDAQGRGNVITVESADVTVKDLSLRGSGDNLTQMNAVIFVKKNATHTIIEDNYLSSTAFGIWVDAAQKVKILHNRIQGNETIRSQDRGNGVHLYSTKGSLVANNEIWHTRDGIYIDTSSHNTLRSNHLHHLRYGVHYMYSYNNKIIGNRTDHTRTGYALMQSKYLTVKNNRSLHDKNYGILLNYIVYSKIDHNVVASINAKNDPNSNGLRVAGTEGKALFVYNSQFNTISNNVFENSDIGIHLTAGSVDNTIFGNNFLRNRVQVKYVATRKQEWSHNGIGNYWSDYLGWDLDANGVGDRAYEPNDGVDRMLWKYPSAKILMHSPAIQTLHWVQQQFPVLRPQGVTDSFPLMKQTYNIGATP